MSDVGPIQFVSVDVPGGITTQTGPIQSSQVGEATAQSALKRAEGRAYPVES